MEKAGVIKNYAYNLSYQILAIIVPLITTPYVSRVLLAEGVGIYSYTYTIAYAFSLFAGLGINSYGQREIAYQQSNKEGRSIVFFELCIIRVITTLAVGAVYLAFSFIYVEYSTALLLQFFLILSVLLDISWYFQGMERFDVVVIRNFIIKIISVVCIFVFVKSSSDVNKYILINSASILVSNFTLLFHLKNEIQKVDRRKINPKTKIKGSLEFFLPVIATQIYSHLDRIMLGALTNNTTEVGYYEQARKIAYLMTTIISSLNGVLLSRVSNLYAQNKYDEIQKYYKNSFKFIVALILPMTVGLFCISDNFTTWFFGTGYEKVSILLKLSCPLVFFMCIGNFAAVQFLSPTGRQNVMTRIYIIAAIINVCLNAAMIPKYLSVGALTASIIAEFYSCIAQIRELKKSRFNFKLTSGIFRFVIASVVMGVAVYSLELYIPMSGIIKSFVEIATGALIYAVILLALKEPLTFEAIKFARDRKH